MNVDVSERAFEDAIEAALLRRETAIAETRDSHDDMPSGGYSKRGAEQRAIAGFIDRETAKINTLIARAREAIDHLQKLRAVLISAEVTGRIDVREEAK